MASTVKTGKLKAPPKHVHWGVGPSPLGDMAIGLTEDGQVCRTALLRGRDPVDVVSGWQAEWKTASFALGKVPRNFMSLPLVMIGTELQVKAWREIMRIPAGEVASYGGIARRIGMPGRARAVGTACALNRLAVIVPCHRVVAANGIGGYGPDGIDMKRELLRAEGVFI